MSSQKTVIFFKNCGPASGHLFVLLNTVRLRTNIACCHEVQLRNSSVHPHNVLSCICVCMCVRAASVSDCTAQKISLSLYHFTSHPLIHISFPVSLSALRSFFVLLLCFPTSFSQVNSVFSWCSHYKLFFKFSPRLFHPRNTLLTTGCRLYRRRAKSRQERVFVCIKCTFTDPISGDGSRLKEMGRKWLLE
jgi:hypothetical protein